MMTRLCNLLMLQVSNGLDWEEIRKAPHMLEETSEIGVYAAAAAETLQEGR